MNGFNQQIRGGLRNSATFAIKGRFGHFIVAVYTDGDLDMITA